LFLLSNNVDPAIMGYKKEDIDALSARIALNTLNLDEDEKEHSIYLANLSPNLQGEEHPHVETIHLHKTTSDLKLVPAHFRFPLLEILTKYTKGFTTLNEGLWVPIEVCLNYAQEP
jgi:hypothetical protein